LNRNSGKELMGQFDTQQYIQASGEVMFKPMNALLGGALANLGEILKDLGPFAGYFSSGLKLLLSPLSSLLKLPANLILDILRTQKGEDGERSSFYKMWKQLLVDNDLIFPGASIATLDPNQLKGEIAKEIYNIGAKGEGLRVIGGQNVSMSNLPAWIPMPKSEYGRVGYTSGFGDRTIFGRTRPHRGIDLDGEPGIKIISPFAGTVYDLNRGAVEGDKRAGGGYGNLVGIEHDQPKIFTFYGHLKDVSNSLKIGSKVSAGEVIGTMGNTGISTGPHLHWEVRQSKHGGQIDPAAWTRSVNKPDAAAPAPTPPGSTPPDPAGGGMGGKRGGSKESGGTVGKFEKGGRVEQSKNSIKVKSNDLFNVTPKSEPNTGSKLRPVTATTPTTATAGRSAAIINITLPGTGSSPSVVQMSSSKSNVKIIEVPIPAKDVMETCNLRRIC